MNRKMSSITSAFEKMKRKNFLPDDLKPEAVIDAPLPIGFGQTNSQPTTVRMMLEWLEPEPGNKILDVGAGSGWTTALLAHIVGPKGKVYAVEKVPELLEFGRENAKRARVKNAEFFRAGKVFGLPRHAPYDRILVSAAAQELPNELLKQLKVGGKLVIPVQYDVLEIEKTGTEKYEIFTHHGFSFVPLV